MNKLKLNLLDILIIGAVVLVLALGIFILKGTSDSSTPSVAAPQNTTAVLDFQIKDADLSLGEAFQEAAQNNAPVWVGIKERFEGKIVDVKVTPAEEIGDDIYSGKAVIAKSQVLYDITVTVEAAAVETDSAITASGTAIRVGEQTAVRGKGFAGFGYIIGLTTR